MAMGVPDPGRIREVFMAALDEEPENLGVYLEEACGGDEDLRARVMLLLSMDSSMPPGFLATLLSRSDCMESIGRVFSAGPTVVSLPDGDPFPAGTPETRSPRKLLHPDPDQPQSIVFGPCIAAGGMGAILEGDDRKLGRKVAVKVMRLDRSSGQERRERFLREAAVLAVLEHPNIVPIHDLGCDSEGRLYYTMKLVRGYSLQKILDDLRKGEPGALREFPLEKLLMIFRKICDGVAFAHSRRILHRDLKPENIMVGEFGEVLVMDWGLAKCLVDGDGLPGGADEDQGAPPFPFNVSDAAESDFAGTLEGSVMGTPKFMSPEQAGGRIDLLDERSDVYSLGAILYAILTLRPPIDGGSLDEVLRKVSTGAITPPTDILTAPREGEVCATPEMPHIGGRRVPSPLSAVAMRALCLDQEERYPDVAALAAEIERYQNGFATSAENLGSIGQLALFIRRNRGISAASGIGALLIVALSAGFMVRVSAEKKAADLQAAEAILARSEMEKERNAARVAEASAQVSLAEAALDDADSRLLRTALGRVPEAFRTDDWQYLRSQLETSSLAIAGASHSAIVAVVPHPSRPSLFVAWDAAGTLSLLNAATGKHEFVFSDKVRPEGSLALAITRDGRRLAVAHGGAISFLDVETGRKEGQWEGISADNLDWSEDGRLLSYAVMSGPGGVLDVTAGRELWQLEKLKDWGYRYRYLFFIPETDRILEVSHLRIAELERETGKEVRRLSDAGGAVMLAKMTSSRREVAVYRADPSTEINLWNLGTGKARVINAGVKYVEFMDFAQGEDRILIATKRNDGDGYLRFGYPDTGLDLGTLFFERIGPIHSHPLTGELVMTGGQPLSVPLGNRKPWRTFKDRGGTLWKFDFFGDDTWFLGPDMSRNRPGAGTDAAGDRFNRFFFHLDVDGDKVIPRESGPALYDCRAYHSSVDGNRFLAYSWYDLLAVYERTPEGFVVRSQGKLAEPSRQRRISSDPGATRFWCNEAIWDAESRERLVTLEVEEGSEIERAIWTPDGESLLGLLSFAEKEGDRLDARYVLASWDTRSGKRTKEEPLPCAMNVLKLSPDGLLVALGGVDKAVHFHDTGSLGFVSRLRAHNKSVANLAWHPTKPLLATTSLDLNIKLWDLRDQTALETIWVMKKEAWELEFSPSGKVLVCHSDDTMVYVWDMRDYLSEAQEGTGAKASSQADRFSGKPDAEPHGKPSLHPSLTTWEEKKPPRSGEWIRTRDSGEPLRQHGGFKEISRDSSYLVQPIGMEIHHQKADLLLSGAKELPEFVFHSAEPATEAPYIVIQLKTPSRIGALTIANRGRDDLFGRAKGLVLWTSIDGKQWQKRWQAETGDSNWTIELGEGVDARFLKLGLPGKGILHLREVVVFGRENPVGK